MYYINDAEESKQGNGSDLYSKPYSNPLITTRPGSILPHSLKPRRKKPFTVSCSLHMAEDQYGPPDLSRYIAGGGRPTYFPSISPSPEFQTSTLVSSSYDMLMFAPTYNYGMVNNGTTSGGESSSAAVIGAGDDGGPVRWPRQETLTLLEIRSRLDPKFKEANQKGPLWDEVSRIMSEEHGYQRSGKKCREKFDNLYKYYKKTKEGNARKRHGKNYRFFRQLEAIYGDQTTNPSETPSLVFGSFHYNHPTNNVSSSSYDPQDSYPCPKISDTTTPSKSQDSDSDSTSSDDTDPNVGMESNDLKRKKRKGFKSKIKESIGAQMKKLMDKQEAWMERMMSAIEHKEHERMVREEQWRKQDEARIERQHKIWASERACMEARDNALMDAFRKLIGKESAIARASQSDLWSDCEITRMMELRSEIMGLRFQRGVGISEEGMWDEIAAGMARFGHHRSAMMCRDKWDSVNDYLIKKRRENGSIGINEGGLLVPYCESSGLGIDHGVRVNDDDHGDSVNDHSCFRYSFGL